MLITNFNYLLKLFMSDIKKDNLKNALCYIPIVAIVLAFTEQNKTEEFKKHMNYWIILFIIYLVIKMILWVFFFYWSFMISSTITLIYFIISGILWYKAYVWEDVKIDVLDDIEDKVKDNFK